MPYNVDVGRDNGTLSRTAQDTSLAGSMVLGANAASYFGVATGLHGGRADASAPGAVAGQTSFSQCCKEAPGARARRRAVRRLFAMIGDPPAWPTT